MSQSCYEVGDGIDFAALPQTVEDGLDEPAAQSAGIVSSVGWRSQMSQINATEDHVGLPTVAPATGLGPARAHGRGTGDGPSPVVLAVARNLDLVVLAIGVGVALALGGPVFGLLVGAGGWLLQRAAAVFNGRLIDRLVAPGRRLGADFVDAFARIWLLAGAIIVAGAAGHRSDGLAAALVVGGCYSLAFALRVLRGRPQGGAER